MKGPVKHRSTDTCTQAQHTVRTTALRLWVIADYLDVHSTDTCTQAQHTVRDSLNHVQSRKQDPKKVLWTFTVYDTA